MRHRLGKKALTQLKKGYQNISRDFSETRQRPWPLFKIFAEHIPQGSKLLDVGCGNGRLLSYLEKEGFTMDYTGVDFCPGLLQEARKAHPKADFLEQDMTQLKLDKRYDIITCVAAFHHLPSVRYRQDVLKRFTQHLRDDGLLMISVWNLWQMRYWKAHLKAWWKCLKSFGQYSPRDLMIPFGKQKEPRYYYAFRAGEIRRLLKKAGYVMDHWELSHHNMVLIAHRRMAKASSDPVPVRGHKIGDALRHPTPIAPCHRCHE